MKFSTSVHPDKSEIICFSNRSDSAVILPILKEGLTRSCQEPIFATTRRMVQPSLNLLCLAALVSFFFVWLSFPETKACFFLKPLPCIYIYINCLHFCFHAVLLSTPILLRLNWHYASQTRIWVSLSTCLSTTVPHKVAPVGRAEETPSRLCGQATALPPVLFCPPGCGQGWPQPMCLSPSSQTTLVNRRRFSFKVFSPTWELMCLFARCWRKKSHQSPCAFFIRLLLISSPLCFQSELPNIQVEANMSCVLMAQVFYHPGIKLWLLETYTVGRSNGC